MENINQACTWRRDIRKRVIRETGWWKRGGEQEHGISCVYASYVLRFDDETQTSSKNQQTCVSHLHTHRNSEMKLGLTRFVLVHLLCLITLNLSADASS